MMLDMETLCPPNKQTKQTYVSPELKIDHMLSVVRWTHHLYSFVRSPLPTRALASEVTALWGSHSSGSRVLTGAQVGQHGFKPHFFHSLETCLSKFLHFSIPQFAYAKMIVRRILWANLYAPLRICNRSTKVILFILVIGFQIDGFIL